MAQLAGGVVEANQSCPHGQAEHYERRWAQVEAMEEKPWPMAWCICCGGPALVGERDPWQGIKCSKCEGEERG